MSGNANANANDFATELPTSKEPMSPGPLKIVEKINDKYKISLSVDEASLSFFGDVNLGKVLLKTQAKDTLIYIENINTSILRFKDLLEGDLSFEKLNLYGARVVIETEKGAQLSNIDKFIAKLKERNKGFFKKATIDSTRLKTLFLANEINISNASVRFINGNKNTTKSIGKLEAKISHFECTDKDTAFNIHSLNLTVDDSIDVSELKTKVIVSKNNLSFLDFAVKVNESVLKGDANLTIDNTISHIKGMEASIKEGYLFPDDFRAYTRLPPLGIPIKLSAKMSGDEDTFNVENMAFYMANNSLKGNIKIANLFNAEQISILDSEIEGVINNDSLSQLHDNSFWSTLSKWGQTTFFGTVKNLSKEEIQANFKLLNNTYSIDVSSTIGNHPSEKGHMFFGTILVNSNDEEKEKYAEIETEAYFENNSKKPLLHAKSFVRYLKTNSTPLKKIYLTTDYKNDKIQILLDSKGSTARVSSNTVIVLKDKGNNIQSHFDVKRLNLSHLSKHVDKTARVRFVSDLSLSCSDSLLSLEGLFKKVYYYKNKLSSKFSDFKFSSAISDSITSFNINSPDLVRGHLISHIKLQDLRKVLKGFSNLDLSKGKQDKNTSKKLDFDMNIQREFFEIFYPEIQSSGDTEIKVSLSESAKALSLELATQKVKISDLVLNDINLQLKIDSTLFAKSDILGIKTKFYKFQKIKISNEVKHDTVFINAQFLAGRKIAKDSCAITLYYTKKKAGNTTIGIGPSRISYGKDSWKMSRSTHNKIIFRSLDSILVDSIQMIARGTQKVTLYGSKQGKIKDLTLSLENISINNILQDYLKKGFGGTANAKLQWLVKEYGDFSKFSASLRDLSIEKKHLGDIRFLYTNNKSVNSALFNLEYKQKGEKTNFKVLGNRNQLGEDGDINIDAFIAFDDLDIDFANIFQIYQLSNFQGKVNGSISIKGPAKKPNIEGSIVLHNGGFLATIPNLDIHFKNGSKAIVDNEGFKLKNVYYSEAKYGTTFVGNGSITHNNFDDFNLYLELKNTGDKGLIFDFPKTDDAILYGQGFLDGIVKLTGKLGAQKLDVIGKTAEGTNVIIPYTDYFSIDDTFVTIDIENKQEKKQEYTVPKNNGSLNLKLEITPDARIEIVSKTETGLEFTNWGNGNILLDTDYGDRFSLWGNYTSARGSLKLDYLLINKTFEILPGGKITWTGEPFEGKFENFKAIYTIFANPDVLFDSPFFERKVETNVILTMNEVFTKPRVSFDLDFPNITPTQRAEILYYLNNNQKKQVQSLSLLAQGKFVNRDFSNISFTNNFSEVASNVLNRFLNNDESLVNVGVSYQSKLSSALRPVSDKSIRTDNLSENNNDFLGVNISTNLTDRISFNGNLGVPLRGGSDGNLGGEGEIEFLVNKKGNLKAAIFNRQNQFRQGIGIQQNYYQGVGLSYNVAFDNFKGLIDSIFGKARVEEEKKKKLPKRSRKKDNVETFN
ncbi:N-acetyl-gamma-glutamyl-phosphate reductase [Elysia marginata]|uniref:N-acetyl-gamma-glutamyl-phosphate reductase n=1 Tax=Elysia marginata TaxID=1093978 RepID=A0AAV4FXT0_9GAST|nr:N-acetyl-gamma-glutamyl-phosphate reductase [Elysia marginata]